MQHLWAWLARWRGLTAVSSVSLRSRPISRVRLQVEQLEERSTPTVTGTGLTGQYYDNMTFSNLMLTRTDADINLNSASEATPAPKMPATAFSIRWTGQVQAQYSQTYTFSTVSDDGIRLLVNGQMLIDDWTAHSPRTDSGSITLSAGQKYSIEVDYYQYLGGFTAQLWWSSPSTAKELVPTSQLYPSASPPPLAPFAVLSAANVTAAGSSQTFSVAYSDTLGVNPATLATGNVRVTGPNGFNQLATLVSVDSPTATKRTATYRISAPGGSWDTADNGTYTVSLVADTVKNMAGTASPPGTLGSFTVNVPAIDWFSEELHDPAIANLARSLDADHSLSRSDMLAIFNAVIANGTVTATELADLRTLVANAGPLGMPDDVSDLANKVVNGDAANGYYQGQPLGDLIAGSSATVLQDLVNKWFLGLDVPTAGSGLTYEKAAGTLFGSGPTYTNVVQGTLNDCYLLAAAAAVAYRDPTALENDFINNGDGTYTVRFFDNGVADYVTVNLMLPAASNGTYDYANFQESLSNSGNTLWVALLEKAYAELSASGWTRGQGLANAYSSIQYGSEAAVIEQLTGLTDSQLPIFDVSSTLATLSSAVTSGQMVCLDSNATTASGIVADHVYVVLSYNATTQTFNTYNPWGFTQQLTWAQVASNFGYWSESNGV